MRKKDCNGPLKRLDWRKNYRMIILMPFLGPATILKIDFGRDDRSLNSLAATLVKASLLAGKAPDPYLVIDARPGAIADEIVAWNRPS